MTVRPLTLVLAASVLVAWPAALAALETDQYLVWTASLRDSTDCINAFVNESIEHTLTRINRGDPGRLSCEEIPQRAYRRLFPTMLRSRFRKFLLQDPSIDRHPDAAVGYFEYLRRSVFRKPAFPFFLPMGRTVRVNDVNVGVDKLGGHFFGFGRRYYLRYQKARRRGLGEEEAMRKVVLWGIQIERYFVGGMLDGVFSYGDLEANYRGLLMARDLCEARPRHLELGPRGWVLKRPVDLRRYVNPLFDESYNNNHFRKDRWSRVRPVLVEDYCGIYRSDELQGELARQRRRTPVSFSHEIVLEYFRRRGRDLQAEHSLEQICPPRVASVPGPVEEAGPDEAGSHQP